ncbi:hypothetical protein ABZV93_25475 [Actinopolymorpha sp. NPDC004070]|uniref:hypothetical protein n=1 Tax=Actinopolymorpha sp. NPDC004070 TaxID=3154548 RepID=UPI0033B1196A
MRSLGLSLPQIADALDEPPYEPSDRPSDDLPAMRDLQELARRWDEVGAAFQVEPAGPRKSPSRRHLQGRTASEPFRG